MNNKAKVVKGFLGSWRVFWLVVILFCMAAGYTAVHAQFPLPFDESYHFTLVNYYAHHLSPFIATQPAELAVVGDATRMGSYLSHYLLSFPLRFVQMIGGDSQSQVVALRFINIGFVVAALALFRVFLVRLTNSRPMSNAVILLFCALPVTSQLAAHINYDNALLICIAALCVLAQRIAARVAEERTVSLAQLAAFVSVGLLGSLVKFTFLPIAAVVMTGVLGLVIYKRAVRLRSLRLNMNLKLISAMALSLVSVGLFVERYGVNVVEYRSLQPDCAAVQPLESCMQYAPWARNYQLKQDATTDATFEGRSLQGFVAHVWAQLMVQGLFGVDNHGTVRTTVLPITIVSMTVAVLLSAGSVALLLYRRDAVTTMVLIAAGIYMAALLQRNYAEFMEFHQVVAVQGRYMVPFVIPVAALGMLGLIEYGRSIARTRQVVASKLTTLYALDVHEAYERSADFWLAKVWRRSPES